jgi:Glycosyl hydrolases family 16/F5/8 type C domain
MSALPATTPARLRTPRQTRFLLVVVIAALLATYAAVFAPSGARAATTLLSQGKPATASSTENVGTPATSAFDGNAGTRWSSAASDPQWLQVDLGASTTISQVVLNWETAYATGFQIQTSTDATNWTSIYSTTTGTGGVQTLNVTGTGRYVRMYGTARATQWGYSLWEFQVYGGGTPPTACLTTNVAQGRTATTSSTENAGTPASSAVDGNTGTRCSSAASDPQWLQVDLGTTTDICQVVLNWETAYGKAFQIQTSTDATNWTSIYSTTTGTGGVQTLNVTGSGRYIRMYGTVRVTQYGYSLWELAVHATSISSPPPPPPTSPPPTTTAPPTGSDVELSYNKPATASTFQDSGNCGACIANRVTDQDVTTRWATSDVNGWVDPGWVYIDLGATATIHKVMLQWDPAYAVAYQIQTSNDAANWTTIYSTATGKGFKETLTGLNGTGRYVRMYGTARSNGYGYSLYEFQVFGTGGNPVAPPALPPNVSLPATRMVFDDEFNGAGGTTPDASKWTADTGTGQNGELEYYTNNKNATMDGAGNLSIEARKESPAENPGSQYTSGRINTLNKFAFTYGHAEARIKVSGTQGLWPAFWMLGANFPTVGWPRSGEIDIMEHVGKVPDSVYSTLHAPAYNGGNGDGSPYTVAGTDFASAFHTYGVDWDASHMTFYVDGNAFFTLNKADVEATRGPWVFDHPFYLILNNAVGGDWPGAPDATTVLPQKMLIDYVRVYQ